MAKLIQFLLGLLAIINPLRNETKGQKLGTWVSLIASILAVIVLALQVFGTPQGQPDTLPEAPAPVVDAYVTVPYVVIHDTDIFDVSDAACNPDNLID